MSVETIFLQRTETGYTNMKGLETAILSFPPNKSLCITISDRSRRTDRQNNLLHMYCGIIGKELGTGKEEIKNILKYKFLLKEKVIESTGEIMQYVGDTHTLNREEFAEFIEKIIEYVGRMFGIVLPSPEDYLTDNNG